MFTKNVKPRRRGRPAGPTDQSITARNHIYAVAQSLIASRGFAETTLRDIAREAGVSVGLLYRYFPSKQAIVLALYDELSARYVEQTAELPPGKWRERFQVALQSSLAVLGPHRMALRALVPTIVGDGEQSIFSAGTEFSRSRVQGVFEKAVQSATDAPKQPLAGALGRMLYLAHLAVILWWLLDKSPKQRATAGLQQLLQQLLPSAALALRLPLLRNFLLSLDVLVQEALLGDSQARSSVSAT